MLRLLRRHLPPHLSCCLSHHLSRRPGQLLTGPGRQLAGALLLSGLAACQASSEPALPGAARLVPLPVVARLPATEGVGAAARLPSPLLIPPPDSLALTPVAPPAAMPDTLVRAIARLHAALGAAAADLRSAVLAQACVGYLTLRAQGRAPASAAPVLAVADLDLPSPTPRFWVIDLQAGKVLHRSLVAHGRGSGGRRATRFSGQLRSACSALGFYRTLGTYEGKNGLSRRLRGLDPGQNSTAEARYVVLHGADYAGAAYLARHGQLGYSRGCPALPHAQAGAIIRVLPAGRVLLLSGPDLASRWLDGAAAGRQFAARGWR